MRRQIPRIGRSKRRDYDSLMKIDSHFVRMLSPREIKEFKDRVSGRVEPYGTQYMLRK